MSRLFATMPREYDIKSDTGKPRLLQTFSLALVAISLLSAGAFAEQRYAVSQTIGSGGSTTFLQMASGSSALSGEVASTANTSIKIPYGVLGEYNAPGSTFGIGVAGISTTGYAVGAEALGASPAMLALNAGTGDGLDGIAQYGSSDFNSQATVSGVFGETTGDGQTGVYGLDDGGVATVNGSPVYGIGVVGASNAGTGGIFFTNNYNSVDGNGGTSGASFGSSFGPQGFVYTAGSELSLLDSDAAFTVGNGESNSLYVDYSSLNRSGSVANGAASDFQLQGDIYLTGHVYTECSVFPVTSTTTACSTVANTPAIASSVTRRTNNGSKVTMYASEQPAATIESEGEASLTDGQAVVNIDPVFASTMSSTLPYLVFITPEGDGALFVKNRTARSFEVHQVGGGRSSLAFAYRIVAHPFADESRLTENLNQRRVTLLNRLSPGALRERTLVAHLRQPRSRVRPIIGARTAATLSAKSASQAPQ